MPKPTWWLTAFIVLSLLLGSSGYQLPTAEASVWQTKVDPWVLSAAQTGETEFLVFLRAQTDLSPAANLHTKSAKISYVYKALTAAAASSQSAIRSQLDGLGIQYQPFWIVNVLWVRGNINLIQQIAQRPDVAHVYANPQVQLSLPEQTQRIIPQTSTTIEPNLTQINADAVWNAGYTGQWVVIGGADTGYVWDHPALINQYRGWDGNTAQHDYNWFDATGLSPATPVDPYGHGTHTMGIMVGDDGASNQIGVAPGAQWIGCRNMDNSGYGTPARYIACYQWFLAPTQTDGTNPRPDLAPDVINNSWGCPPSEGCTDPDILLMAVQNVNAAGILTVHSAGNGGYSGCESINQPATIYEESFSVAAINSKDTIASFSSRGPVTVDGSNRLKPNISAPGVSIRSTTNNGGYGYKQGTSMAAPHITGVGALLISANPALAGQVETIKTLIQDTAVPLYTTEGCGEDTSTSLPNNTYGWGRVDVWAAYQEVPHGLLVDKTASEAILQGDVLTYTLTVTNSHPFSNTHNIILTDTIPNKTAFLSATGNYSITGRLVTWELGDLAAKDSTQVELAVRVSGGVTGTITNGLFGVQSDEVTIPVRGEVVHTLVHEPGVELSSSESGIIYNPCDPSIQLIYTHQVTNTGNYTDSYQLTSNSSQGWITFVDDYFSLASGETAFFDIEVHPPCPTSSGMIDITKITSTSLADESISATITDTTKIGYQKLLPLIFNP